MTINYPEYYQKCCNLYGNEASKSLYNIRLQTIDPYSTSNTLTLPSNYLDIICDIGRETHQLFQDQSNIYTPKNANPKKENLRRLKDPLKVNRVNDLANALLPQIESVFFNSYVHLSHLYIYRSIITKAEPASSWLWHYDNYPTEIYKIIIYLTDVNETAGPFEYLTDQDDKPIIVDPSRTGPGNWNKPKWKGSRVPPKIMRRYSEKGCRIKKLTGKIGTGVLFDNNCIHRATVAQSQHRDVIALQIKPYEKPLRPFIHKNWTVSFQYKGLSKCPTSLKSNIDI